MDIEHVIIFLALLSYVLYTKMQMDHVTTHEETLYIILQ